MALPIDPRSASTAVGKPIGAFIPPRLRESTVRTLDEIAGWIAFSTDEKRAVLVALPERRKRSGGA